eukprot:scaffold67355_cov75-Phaeocystis_antarctica.AAC.1
MHHMLILRSLTWARSKSQQRHEVIRIAKEATESVEDRREDDVDSSKCPASVQSNGRRWYGQTVSVM